MLLTNSLLKSLFPSLSHYIFPTKSLFTNILHSTFYQTPHPPPPNFTNIKEKKKRWRNVQWKIKELLNKSTIILFYLYLFFNIY